VPRRRSSGSARHPPSPPTGATPAVRRSWSRYLPAPQIGSARAARRTAPARARSSPRRRRRRPDPQGRGVRPGACGRNSRPPVLQDAHSQSTPARPLEFFPCQPPCPADAAPCDSAVLAPSSVGPSWPAAFRPADWTRDKALRAKLPPSLRSASSSSESPSCNGGASPHSPARRPPELPPPMAPQRPWHSGAFPRPTARELPAPGSGGGGANAGRGFRKGSLVPNPALRATPRLRASPLHKRPFM